MADDVNIGVMMITRRSVLAGSSAALIAGIAPRGLWAATEADVVVIGAGLAGLIAAHRLELAGLKVVIVEGERRVGGRLHTLDDLPGKPDAGGIQIGSGYRQLRGIADELGVELIEGGGAGAGAAESRSALFRINGQTVTATDWPMSSANRLDEAERATLPLALAQLHGSKLPRLTKSEDWMTADPALDISYAAALAKSGASAEALRLIEANLNGNTLAGMSQIHMMRATAIFREGAGPTATIKGGSQRLPEAMAAALKSDIRLGQRVQAISHDADGVTLTLTGGKRIRARFAICTIPFAALRNVPINGGLDPAINAMIARLPYTRASFAYISATGAFWKNDGHPATLWTDDPALGRVFVLGEDPPMLKLWVTGANADRLDRMPEKQASAEIIQRIEAARPAAKGKLRVDRFFSWQKSPFARGIYHHIGTGQAAMLAHAMQADGSRLFFAGEHLSQQSSGMEAALLSGRKAALLITERAG